MTAFVFRAKDGKVISAEIESSAFSLNEANPGADTYVYTGGRNASNGIMVSSAQINSARLNFVRQYIHEHGGIWQVNFSDEKGILFNNDILVPTDGIGTADASKMPETLAGVGLYVAVPK